MIVKCLGPGCGNVLFETAPLDEKGHMGIVPPVPKLHGKGNEHYYVCESRGGGNFITLSKSEHDVPQSKITYFRPKGEF